MAMLEIEGLSKRYEKFFLDNVGFALDEGYIMGFIGSNGAGKTTTLKCMMNLVRADAGTVRVFGNDLKEHELSAKQDIALMLGPGDYYSRRRLETVAAVVKRFYPNWDDGIYQSLLKRFELDPAKKIKELSHGMKIKFSLTLALSHGARLIILDEPTSGLDPVARDDLLELFQELIEDGTRSILYSTHITSDLEQCADFITYIDNGRIIESTTKDGLLDSYRIVSGSERDLDGMRDSLIAWKKNSFGFQGLMKTADLTEEQLSTASIPKLDDIMIYHAKRRKEHEQSAS